MVIVAILAIWAALVSAAFGLIMGTLFWGASLIMPPSAVFGVLAGVFVFPFAYVYFAQRV